MKTLAVYEYATLGHLLPVSLYSERACPISFDPCPMDKVVPETLADQWFVCSEADHRTVSVSLTVYPV